MSNYLQIYLSTWISLNLWTNLRKQFNRKSKVDPDTLSQVLFQAVSLSFPKFKDDKEEHTLMRGTFSNVGETTRTLKCVSEPGGTLCIKDSLTTIRCTGWKASTSFFFIADSTGLSKIKKNNAMVSSCFL